MTNIPFPNPHDADALNDYLDSLVAGKPANPGTEVESTAQAFHALASRANVQFPQQSESFAKGQETVHTATLTAPVSNRTRRQSVSESKGRSYGWLGAVIVAGLLLSMLGSAWINREPRNPNENLAWAPGTIKSTPDSTPPWTQPISYSECPQDEVVPVDRENNPSGTRYSLEDYEGLTSQRDYEIVGPANPEDAQAVVTSMRGTLACGTRNESNQAWTARFEWENRTTAGRESLAGIEDDRAEASVSVSNWLRDDLGLTPMGMVVNQDPSELELDGSEALITQGLPNPAYTVEFADGRIGIIPSGVYCSGLPEGMNEDTLPGFAPMMSIFVYQDGEWLLDENLQVCIGDCTATPAASPVSTEGDVWGVTTDPMATPEE